MEKIQLSVNVDKTNWYSLTQEDPYMKVWRKLFKGIYETHRIDGPAIIRAYKKVWYIEGDFVRSERA